jgi:D-alanyl-D-alanine carboxypeptidase
MVANDQMAIASITKTVIAAQVMQLVEAGRLHLDDLVADRLPPDLDFETSGETIANLLSHRHGYPDDPFDVESITNDPTHAWTTAEVLGLLPPERNPVSQAWRYAGITYVLLGLILEHVEGRPLAEVLRRGVLAGDAYERVIYQPDEHPTEPMAMPEGESADIFEERGGYLPSLAAVTAANSEGAIASDSLSLAAWFAALCAGEVVSPASLDEMTDFGERSEYGLGLWDRRSEYGPQSGALGHTGALFGYRTAALCFQNPSAVVVVLANVEEHDVDITAGNLWRAANTP